MFKKTLIANRGEIAVRIIKACRELGIESVLAASSIDAESSLAARLADQVVRIGGPRASESYLNLSAIIAAADKTGSDSVHPGYGFLSEDQRFAQACDEIGVKFIGPRADTLEKVGDKATAREVAQAAGVPVSPGARLPDRITGPMAERLASEVGYPLLIKAVHGGGGRGMRLVENPDVFVESAAAAATEAEAAFGNASIYVEHYVKRARHIEVQIMGVANGETLVLGDRDCSVQRRHQKLIEEAPAPTLSEELRKDIHDAARRIGRFLQFENAGTVEFVVDDVSGEYFFLEVNARIQVEHPVTEAVTGIDIVRTQFEVASRSALNALVRDQPTVTGVAIECRVNAEAPALNFRPSPGTLTQWLPPTYSCARVDSHCYAGYSVPPFYDSLLAKVITFGADRNEAIENMENALHTFDVTGIETTIEWSRQLICSNEFKTSEIHTRWVDEHYLSHS